MDVYACWYQKCFGYACRLDSGRWMFVPDLGQPDQNVYKELHLDELVFKNTEEKRFEQASRASSSLLGRVRGLVFPRYRAQSIAGRLLTRS